MPQTKAWIYAALQVMTVPKSGPDCRTREEASDPPVLIETLTHDEDGNMTTRTDVLANEVITYGWNDFDKLVKVSSADSGGPKGKAVTQSNTVKVDQRYDANGIRKRKLDKAGDSSAEFTSGISTLASKAAVISSSSPTISYIQGHQILGAEVNGNFQYFLTDALGTVRDVLDDSGTVIRSMEFNEHGKLLSSSGSGTFAPKTYQGALSVNDDRNDSGLYLMEHRHFAPELGRFINRDPIGFEGGLNLFNGAGASPVTMVDPSGLDVSGSVLYQGCQRVARSGGGAALSNPAGAAIGITAAAGLGIIYMAKEMSDVREAQAQADATAEWQQSGRLPKGVSVGSGSGNQDTCHARCQLVPIKKDGCDNRQTTYRGGPNMMGNLGMTALCQASKRLIQMRDGRWYTRHCQCACRSTGWQWFAIG